MMRLQFRKLLLLLAVIAIVPILDAAIAAPSQDKPSVSGDGLQAFAAVRPIDTHVHAFRTDPAVSAMLARLHLQVLDICVADRSKSFGDLAAETANARDFVHSNRGHAKLCVTFSPFEFQQKDFAANTIKQLHQEFASGAIAVKIWKNIGMEIKTS